ncbi:MAG: acyl dehydratase [Hasllibacter sp.]
MDPARAAALYAALDLPGPPPGAGDPLPPFFHQAHFWTPVRPSELGPDGHPRQGLGPIPETGLPHRMWAGGRLTFHAPLGAGRPAERVTVRERMTRKDGRSGPLAFVTLRHEIRQDGTARVTEWQDLVYRGPGPAAAPPPAPDWPEVARHGTDPVLLFRYSALTGNGHRIHYDADYAREAEGYAGPVVHGPLLAQWMMLAAGPMDGFAFRARAPMTCGATARVLRDGARMAVASAGGLHMEGTVL